MCLGEVARVVGPPVDGTVRVRAQHRTMTASLLTLDEAVGPGDWILVHSGFALARLSPAQARDAIEIRGEPTTAEQVP